MKIVIVEDEMLAADRLQTLIRQCEPNADIVGSFDSVAESVTYFQSGNSADLLMLDIQVADGKTFEIFDRVSIDIPVVFTTAYDQYALSAFRYFSIDYLLKPIQPDELRTALQKYRKLSARQGLGADALNALKDLIGKPEKNYRERFTIKAGNKLQYKSVKDVAFFFADGKTAYLVTKKEARKYLIDITLEDLENSLDPKFFFRVSRKHIVCVDAIAEVRGLISGKLEVILNQPCDQEILVSRERAQQFRRWLNQ
ncbi:MAG TPA: LytTR family DNA-binding domain-containing protein [Chryseosolibacter sp.]